MKKTLFIMFDFPPREGGAQKYDWDIIRALPKDKVVILAQKWGEWREFDKKSGYRTYRLPWGWIEKLKVPIMVFVVMYLVLKEKIEYIWFSKYSRIIYISTFIPSQCMQIPYGLCIFGEDLAWVEQDFGLPFPRLAKKIQIAVLKKAEHIVSNSWFSTSLLPIGLKYSVIHPCTSQPFLGNPPQRKKGDGVTFLSVGKLTRKKGFDLVIKALAQGLPGVEKFRYIIAGRGEGEGELRNLVSEMGMQDVVLFLGQTSDEEKHRLYQCADVFVMPSRIEGFGIVFLEAALHGLCTVGSRAGGIPEAVEEGVTGLLIESGNTEELKRTLAALGSNPILREKMGEAARERCLRDFSWEQFARKWAGLFDMLDY